FSTLQDLVILKPLYLRFKNGVQGFCNTFM
ncbi:MAG: hypothetical protein RIR05_1450, partial [Bacteroidota bacterium]